MSEKNSMPLEWRRTKCIDCMKRCQPQPDEPMVTMYRGVELIKEPLVSATGSNYGMHLYTRHPDTRQPWGAVIHCSDPGRGFGWYIFPGVQIGDWSWTRPGSKPEKLSRKFDGEDKAIDAVLDAIMEFVPGIQPRKEEEYPPPQKLKDELRWMQDSEHYYIHGLHPGGWDWEKPRKESEFATEQDAIDAFLEMHDLKRFHLQIFSAGIKAIAQKIEEMEKPT